MSVSNEIFLWVLREAEKPGDELIPSDLVNVVLSQSEPIRALTDHDQASLFFEAIRCQFEFIAIARVSGNQPSAEDVGRWAALMRWFGRELQQWRLVNDQKYHKLTALFVLSTYCEQNGFLWTALPNGVEQNAELLCTLEKLIAGISCDFSARGSGYEPIWERETVERFAVADTEEDWLTISELWPSLATSIIPSVFQEQAVQCLYRFGFEYLVQAVSGTRKAILAMQFAGSLSIGQRFLLGIASNNTYVQFGCVYQTFFHMPKTSCLDYEEQKSLIKLLLRVADDEPRWEKWMQVFNRYPIRYPAMQQSLGQTLAIAPEVALYAYVDSIRLNTASDGSRQSVAECLRAFRTTASTERSQTMWKLAYQRWSKWQFELENKEKHLSKIGCSELDYAVVAYGIECMNDEERAAVLVEISDALRVVNNSWHASDSDCITCWNRLLSQFQPYAHAAQVMCLEEDWLMEGKYYHLLPDFQHERYFKMMYDMR